VPLPNVPVPPCRIVDTRTPVVSPIPSGGFRNFSISGLCGVPTRAIHGLAVNLNVLGELGESEQLLRKALDIHTKLYGEQHLDTSNMVNSLASLLHDLKRYDEANALYRRALVVQEACRARMDPRLRSL
jgi:tetratricopeptide (TPR) repeat protein